MNVRRLLIASAFASASSISNAETTTDVVCSYAPSQSKAVNRITAATGGAAAGAAALLKSTGLQFVAHSSGGYILTGSGGYVAGTLLSPLVVPTAVAATVVVGGSAIVIELVCAPRNHPDAIASVRKITAEFNQAVRAANNKAIDVRDSAGLRVRELNEDGIVMRDQALGKIKGANNRGIEIRDKAASSFAGIF